MEPPSAISTSKMTDIGASKPAFEKPSAAWVFRQASGYGLFEPFLKPNDLITCGWSTPKEIMEKADFYALRELIHQTYYQNESDKHPAGKAAGNVKRFRDAIQIGDWVAVPAGNAFYLAKVTSNAFWDDSRPESKGFNLFRCVKWLNDGKAIAKDLATGPVRARLKIFNTSAEATDLIDDFYGALSFAVEGATKEDIVRQFESKLVETVVLELRNGHMDDNKLERLVAALFRKIGAREVRVTGGTGDLGADVVGFFNFGTLASLKFGAQVKWHQGKTDAWALQELDKAWELEGLQIGFAVTTADAFSDEAQKYHKELGEKGRTIHLITGKELALQLLEAGISVWQS